MARSMAAYTSSGKIFSSARYRNGLSPRRAPGLMDLITFFSLLASQPEPLLGHDAQARLLQPCIDLAGQIASGRIGLDDRKRPLDSHLAALLVPQENRGFSYTAAARAATPIPAGARRRCPG